MTKITNINHLIAHLRDIRDEHGIDLPVRFSYKGNVEFNLDCVDLKVITTHRYTETDSTTDSELVITLH